MPKRARFITFERIHRNGKMTPMPMLAERRRADGHDGLEAVQPRGTASRAQNVDECILAALALGKIVVCDRFTDSTLAYQGYARGLGEEAVLALDRIACRGLTPDLTLLIDVDVECGLERAQKRNAGSDAAETRMDDQSLEFHRKVREAYLALAKKHADRFRTIDGRGTPGTVAERVWANLAAYV